MEEESIERESTVYLLPERKVKVRFIVTIIYAVVLIVVPGAWLHKIPALIFFVLTVGTYVNVRLCGSRIERVWTIGFFPSRVRKWSLDKFLAIETGTSDDEPLGGIFALLFFRLWIFKLIVDAMFPWMGGELKLWLRGKKGGRVRAWEGNSNAQFENNRNLLEERLCMPVQRR